MSQCINLTANELAEYKKTLKNYSDGFIKAAVSLYLERNPEAKGELPSASRLNEFIDNNKYGINSLSF